MSAKLNAYAPRVLSFLRIVTGLMFLQHGTQKIFGFPKEPMFPFDIASQIGIGGVLELVGGVLIILGLFTRPVAFVMSGMMAVAYFQFHAAAGGPFPLVNGGELAALYCWIFLYLVFAGGGQWSLDRLVLKRD